tara:strand:+ start:1340 stop:2971 length:1632 start_codon:yes stop_codon:yes gene_type:complete
MAQQTINIGSSANDGTGDPLRTAFDKINDNFTELYGSTSEANDLIEDSTPQLGGDLDVNGRRITSARSNEDIVLLPNGTGGVVASAIRIAGTTISSDDSSIININEGLVVDGTASVSGAATLSSTIAVTGAATLSSTLGVSGATTLTTTNIDNLTIQDSNITSSSNADINITPGGTGSTIIGSSITIKGTTISSADSSTININEGLVVDGTGNFSGTLTTAALTTVGTHTVTGQADIEGVTIKDNTISSNASDSDLEISANGSGKVDVEGVSFFGTTLTAADSSTININEGLVVDGTASVSGNATVGGTLGVTGVATFTATPVILADLTVQGSINADTIVSASNGDITIDPAGTGEINLTGPVTHTGTQTTTGQLNVDNLRLDGNVLSATSGAITLTPADGQNVTVTGTNVNFVAGEANFTLMEATTARADVIESDTSNGDLVFNTQGTGVFDFNAAIKMAEVSKPTAVADHGFIYVKDDSGTGEVFVLDGADNETKISPHNDNGEWEYYSRNSSTGKTVRINMEAMIRDLEKFTGNKYIETV